MVIGIDASRAEAKIKTGVERYCFEIIKAMRASRPADAKVVLYSCEPLPPELGPFDDNWRNAVLKWPPRYGWTALRLSWEMLRRAPDVLFVPGYKLPRIIPKRSVVTIHDASFIEAAELYAPSDARRQRVALADSCRRASAVIVPSQYVAEQLGSLVNGKTSVIAHGASVGKPPRLGGKFQNRFVFLGRVEKKKNLGVLIEAFNGFAKSHPDYRLLFVGKLGFGGEAIIAQAKAAPASAQIEFCGALLDEEAFKLISRSAALLHPCPCEGFGLPAIEAMSLGVPVVAANHGAVAEAVADAGLLVPFDNAAKWAEAMNQITFDIFRKPLIEKGRARAKEFSWTSAAEKTWKVLLGIRG